MRWNLQVSCTFRPTPYYTWQFILLRTSMFTIYFKAQSSYLQVEVHPGPNMHHNSLPDDFSYPSTSISMNSTYMPNARATLTFPVPFETSAQPKQAELIMHRQHRLILNPHGRNILAHLIQVPVCQPFPHR